MKNEDLQSHMKEGKMIIATVSSDVAVKIWTMF
jgi:hypothetical protein